MDIAVSLPQNGYTVTVRRGALSEAGKLFDLDRRVLVVTDDGVPPVYARTVAAQCKAPTVVTLPQGEATKSLPYYAKLLHVLLENHFTRTDCVVAVGGGVVGDLAGFAAASFLRGVDFYNIPTTVLSQVDSSIGGKVAIDFDGIKNCVGAFYQPRAVLVDSQVLETLPPRQVANGLAEAVKMALTFDASLFALFETEDPTAHMEEIIARSLQIKANVVMQDEKESGLRRVLNFGHTVGHGIEAAGMQELYHGECVALGMLPMCSAAVRARLLPVLEKLGLPTACHVSAEAAWAALTHDKKLSGDMLTAIFCETVGSFEMRKMPLSALKETVFGLLEG
ncbi:MAG: 3-dehydroquinate synthase [Clostridia bacterium]|nr:MAG: 3-dehydroquinate synthase [Clostridia bacterium]